MPWPLQKIGMLIWPAVTLALTGCVVDEMNTYKEWARYRAQSDAGQPVQSSSKAAHLARSGHNKPPRGTAPMKRTSHQELRLPSAPYKLRVCAWVNGTPIFTSELHKAAKPEVLRLRGTPEPEYSAQRKAILKKVLKKLIEDDVVYQDAHEKLKKHPSALKQIKEEADKHFDENVLKHRETLELTEWEYKRELARQGTSLKLMRKQAERSFLVQQYLFSRVAHIKDQINQDKVREYYDQHKSEFRTVDRVEWQYIFIAAGTKKHPTMKDARAFAEQLLRRLQNGEPFANLVPFDDGYAIARQGKGLGEHRGEIKPAEVERFLFGMKAGQFGLLESEASAGVHVFRLEKREHGGQMPFDVKVQATIRKRLENDLLSREYKHVIRELEARTVIEVDPDALK